MLKIGITGGIGSGKTYVANLFEKAHVPVYYADIVAKKIMNGNSKLKEEVKEAFGNESYVDGMLNREYLSEKIFSNKEYLKKMNNIMSPYIESDYHKWCEKNNHRHFTCIESANLFETGLNENLNYVINIACDLDIKLERIKKRDSFRTEEEIRNIVNSQLTDKDRNKLADYIIFNNGKDNSVEREILNVKDMFIDENYDMVNNITRIHIRSDKTRKLIKEMLNRNELMITKL